MIASVHAIKKYVLNGFDVCHLVFGAAFRVPKLLFQDFFFCSAFVMLVFIVFNSSRLKMKKIISSETARANMVFSIKLRGMKSGSIKEESIAVPAVRKIIPSIKGFCDICSGYILFAE